MSAFENGTFNLSYEPFDMRELLKQLKLSLEDESRRKGVKLSVAILGEITASLIGDGARVKQMLSNLLTNAIKFTPEGGKASLEASVLSIRGTKAIYRFVITDNGIGMSEEFLEHMWSPFQQERGGNSREFGGSGLGLAVTKNIIDLMGGTITCESKPGHGTVFTADVPIEVHEAASDEGQAREEKIDTTVLKGKKVLIAEDNEINMEIACELITANGMIADRACDGLEAVQRFGDSQPGEYSAVLMDIQMPHMDGYDAAKAIRAQQRSDALTVPIIAVSANALGDDITRSASAGMNEHIPKPLDREGLLAILCKYLGEK